MSQLDSQNACGEQPLSTNEVLTQKWRQIFVDSYTTNIGANAVKLKFVPHTDTDTDTEIRYFRELQSKIRIYESEIETLTQRNRDAVRRGDDIDRQSSEYQKTAVEAIRQRDEARAKLNEYARHMERDTRERDEARAERDEMRAVRNAAIERSKNYAEKLRKTREECDAALQVVAAQQAEIDKLKAIVAGSKNAAANPNPQSSDPIGAEPIPEAKKHNPFREFPVERRRVGL